MAASDQLDETTSMDREALVAAILDLERDRDTQLEDEALAQDLSAHIKGYVDELVSLRANGDATAGDSADDTGDGGGEDGGSDDGTEESDTAAQQQKRRRRRGRQKTDLPDGPVPELSSVSPGEQARWIFMERYISLEKHEEILGLNFQPEVFAEHQEGFDRLIKDLLLLPRAMEAAQKNDITGLQKVFARCIPVFRYPQIASDGGEPAESSVQNLRQAYPAYFYKRRKKPNWFEARDFYTDAVPGPRWVLCDTEYMNCTLRPPERKLASYARDWDLPPEYAHQKSIVEDIYDRIIVGEATGEDLFAGHTSNLTSTRYRSRKTRRLVFTVQKVHKITLHGKNGLPHWRATRRLWPGVHPSLAFPDAPAA
ncbi:MAG: hypothetical protein O2782_10125 [bacterium]|nr:hypothetical protein [bacterium]